MIITLSDTTTQVEIKEALTWGDMEYIQSAMYDGIKVNSASNVDMDMKGITEMKYRLLERTVIEIRKGETKSKFTREWINNLSPQDGDLVYSSVDKLNKKK